MSHNVESMAYVGQAPWHGLGAEVSPNLSVPEVLKAAGLDWTVTVESPVVRGKTINSVRVMVRDDNDYILGWCGSRYTAVQNHEAFSFFTDYLKAGQLHIETAGSLDRGRHVWGLAKLHDSFELEGGDKVEAYLLLMHPHVHGKAGMFMFTPIRVVCKNTLNMALGEKDFRKKTRFLHYKGWDGDVAQKVQRDLGICKDLMLDFRDKAAILSAAKAKESDIMEYIGEFFMPGEESRIAQLDITDSARRVIELVEKSPGSDLKSSRGTWWGAYNAVSYFIDHERGANQDGRLTSSWFGRWGLFKRKAFEHAVIRAKKDLQLAS